MSRSLTTKSSAMVRYKKFSLRTPVVGGADASAQHQSKIINLVQPIKSLKPKSSPQTIVYHPSKVRVQSIAISIPSKLPEANPESFPVTESKYLEGTTRTPSLKSYSEIPDNLPEASVARRQRPRKKNLSVRKGINYRNSKQPTVPEEVTEATTERHETSTFRIFKYTTTTERQKNWKGTSAGINFRRPTSRSRTYSTQKPEGSRSSLFPNQMRLEKIHPVHPPETTSRPVETQIPDLAILPDEFPEFLPETATEFEIITVKLPSAEESSVPTQERMPPESEEKLTSDGTGFKPEVLSLLGRFPTGSRNVPGKNAQRIHPESSEESKLQKYIKQIEKEKEQYAEALKRLQEAVTTYPESETVQNLLIPETREETQLNRYDPEQQKQQQLPRSELATGRKITSGQTQNSGDADENDYLRVTLPPSAYGKRLPESNKDPQRTKDKSEQITQLKRIKAWHPQSSKYPPGKHPHQTNSGPDSSLHLIYTPPIHPYQPPAFYHAEGGSSSAKQLPPYPPNEIYSTKLQLDTIQEVPETYQSPQKDSFTPSYQLDTIHQVPVTYQPPNKEFYPPGHHSDTVDELPVTYQPPNKEFYHPGHQYDTVDELPVTYQPPNKEFYSPAHHQSEPPTYQSPYKELNQPRHQPDHHQSSEKRYHPPSHKQDTISSLPVTDQPPVKEYYPPSRQPDHSGSPPVKYWSLNNGFYQQPHQPDTVHELQDPYQPPLQKFDQPKQHKDHPQIPSVGYQSPQKDNYPPSHQPHTIHEVPETYQPPVKQFDPPSYQHEHSQNPPAAYQSPVKEFNPPPRQSDEFQDLPVTYQPPNKEYYPPGHQPSYSQISSGTYQPPVKKYYPPPHQSEVPVTYQPPVKEYYPPSHQQDPPNPPLDLVQEVPVTYQPSEKDLYPPSHQLDAVEEVPVTHQPTEKKFYSPTHQLDTIPELPLTYQPPEKKFYPPSPQLDPTKPLPATNQSPSIENRPQSPHPHHETRSEDLVLVYEPPTKEYRPVSYLENLESTRVQNKDVEWVRLIQTTPRPEDFPFQDTIYYPTPDGNGKPISDSELVYNFPSTITRNPDTKETSSGTNSGAPNTEKGSIHIDPGILDGTDWNPSIRGQNGRPNSENPEDNSSETPNRSPIRTQSERPTTAAPDLKLVYFNPEWTEKYSPVTDKPSPEVDETRKPVVIPKTAAKTAYRILNPPDTQPTEKPNTGFDWLEQLKTHFANPIVLDLSPAGFNSPNRNPPELNPPEQNPPGLVKEFQRQPKKTSLGNPAPIQHPAQSGWVDRNTGIRNSNEQVYR